MSLLDVLKPSTPLTGHDHLPRRQHLLGDTTPARSPKGLKADLLAALAKDQPLRREQLRDRLKCNNDELEQAINGLRTLHKLYGIKGEGYRLGPRPTGAGPEEPPTQETDMPSGVYDRTKAKARRNAKKTTDDSAVTPPATKPEKKTRRRRAGAKDAGIAARARKPNGEASFAINDAGCVTVVGTDGARVELSGPDTKRLEAFIGRTKQIRG